MGVLILFLLFFQVCKLIEGRDIYIKMTYREKIKKNDSSQEIAKSTMFAIFNVNFLKNATVDGKLEGMEGLPDEALTAIFGKQPNC